MKRFLLLAALALALPTAVFAGNHVDYTNTGGNLTGSSSGLTLTGSTLIAVNGLNGLGLVTGSDLGSLSFGTGALLSGSLTANSCSGGGTGCVIATFASAGSWFKVTGNGTSGIPNNTLFSGSFQGPVQLFLTGSADGTHTYIVMGSLGTNSPVSQIVLSTGKGYFDGDATITSGDTTLVVPEPASLGLLGTGLIGLAGIVRRKLKA